MKYGIIGGSGLTRLKDLKVDHREVVKTPYGEASAPLIHGRFGDVELVFLPRHGSGHRLPPDRINYRANIWAMVVLPPIPNRSRCWTRRTITSS